jgi:hypothetical protein
VLAIENDVEEFETNSNSSSGIEVPPVFHIKLIHLHSYEFNMIVSKKAEYCFKLA